MSYVYVSLKIMCGSSRKRNAYLRNKVANSRPAQLDDSRGTICKKDKQLRAAISFVVARVQVGKGEISGWHFKFARLQIVDCRLVGVMERDCRLSTAALGLLYYPPMIAM
jgi:hypothetical protein